MGLSRYSAQKIFKECKGAFISENGQLKKVDKYKVLSKLQKDSIEYIEAQRLLYRDYDNGQKTVHFIYIFKRSRAQCLNSRRRFVQIFFCYKIQSRRRYCIGFIHRTSSEYRFGYVQCQTFRCVEDEMAPGRPKRDFPTQLGQERQKAPTRKH